MINIQETRKICKESIEQILADYLKEVISLHEERICCLEDSEASKGERERWEQYCAICGRLLMGHAWTLYKEVYVHHLCQERMSDDR